MGKHDVIILTPTKRNCLFVKRGGEMWVLVEYSYVFVFEASVESFIHIYMDSVYVCVSVRACLFGVFVHCEILYRWPS